jgi:hypothetical protein
MTRRLETRFATVVVLAVALVTLFAIAGFSASLTSDQIVSPSASHFPQNKQNESPMAASPFNPDVVVSGGNDEIEEPNCTLVDGASSCPFDPSTDTTGVYVSTNGGGSYSHQILNWWPSGGTVSTGDPIVAFGPKPNHASNADGGRLYAGGLAVPPTASANQVQLAVVWSDDQGATWSDPVNISKFDSKPHFNDKPSLWADANPDSPHYGNVYAAWSFFPGNGSLREGFSFPDSIMFSRSTDFGRTWSKATKLSGASRNNGAVGGRQGSSIRSGPDGSVYVTWVDAVDKTSTMAFTVSHDGGTTFGRPTYPAPILGNPTLPGTSFRNGSFPALDVSQGTGAIFATWTDYDPDAGHGVVTLVRSANGGASWTASTVADITGRSPYFPAVAVTPDGSAIFVGFQDVNDLPTDTTPAIGVANLRTHYVLSIDAGAHFGSPVLIRSSGDPEASSTNSLGGQFLGDYNGAVATDSTVWFSFTDVSGGATCPAVTAFRYSGGDRPDIYADCPAAFGNTDIRVAELAL